MSDKFELQLELFTNAVAKFESIDDHENIFTKLTAGNLWIYQNNYMLGHLHQLIKIYETVLRTIGENNFKFLARNYLLSFPPSTENMDDFGETFDTFLQGSSEVKNIFFLPGLAQLDWFLYSQNAPMDNFLKLPEGSFDLWHAVKLGQPINNMSINELNTETIRIKIINSEYFLVKSTDF